MIEFRGFAGCHLHKHSRWRVHISRQPVTVYEGEGSSHESSSQAQVAKDDKEGRGYVHVRTQGRTSMSTPVHQVSFKDSKVFYRANTAPKRVWLHCLFAQPPIRFQNRLDIRVLNPLTSSQRRCSLAHGPSPTAALRSRESPPPRPPLRQSAAAPRQPEGYILLSPRRVGVQLNHFKPDLLT